LSFSVNNYLLSFCFPLLSGFWAIFPYKRPRLSLGNPLFYKSALGVALSNQPLGVFEYLPE